MEKYDFSGWATKNDLLCGDGRTIRKDAFKHNDGNTVPLVWNHQHDNPDNVLGHAMLENREDGVYAYCTFNDSESGRQAKELVQHGDVKSLSIYANRLKQVGMDVIHGTIRELSLVLAGANPGAYIDFIMAHDDNGEDSFVANYDENIMMIMHADDSKKEETKKEESTVADEAKKEESAVADEAKKETGSDKEQNESKKELTIEDLKKRYDAMSADDKEVVHGFVALALEDKDTTENENVKHSEGGNNSMKTNAFDQAEVREGNVLSHSDQKEILKMAKEAGSFQKALNAYVEDNAIAHADTAETVSGFVQDGEGNITNLFPEYKDVRPGAPELLTNDQGWISVVMSKVHKSPIARIRTSHVDIRNMDTLRAKGYKKGDPKAPTGNIKLVRRTTDPQTVYVKNVLHRDDILDIEDFDYVQYLYNIDKMMLNEELATAIMFGDGRDDGDDYKIAPDKIRPIWTDDDLYTIHYDIDLEKARTELQGSNTGANFGENYVRAEAMINTVLYAREKYKGSGTPDYYIDPHSLNVMLLARDLNGRRIYASKSELAAALNVGNIYTVEQMADKTRTTTDGKTKKLHGIIANLSDYSLGSMKGGQVTHFTQFDIDFNQEKSLLETRCSGALTKVYSAIAIEEDITQAAG